MRICKKRLDSLEIKDIKDKNVARKIRKVLENLESCRVNKKIFKLSI